MTVITSMIQSIRKAALYNRYELAPPRVVLWPDEERLWVEGDRSAEGAVFRRAG